MIEFELPPRFTGVWSTRSDKDILSQVSIFLTGDVIKVGCVGGYLVTLPLVRLAMEVFAEESKCFVVAEDFVWLSRVKLFL